MHAVRGIATDGRATFLYHTTPMASYWYVASYVHLFMYVLCMTSYNLATIKA